MTGKVVILNGSLRPEQWPDEDCMKSCGMDIGATASKLVDSHGEDAGLVARQWAMCAKKAGDPSRHRAWLQVQNVINKLCSDSLLKKNIKARTQFSPRPRPAK